VKESDKSCALCAFLNRDELPSLFDFANYENEKQLINKIIEEMKKTVLYVRVCVVRCEGISNKFSTGIVGKQICRTVLSDAYTLWVEK
jgi:hypothetical protein